MTASMRHAGDPSTGSILDVWTSLAGLPRAADTLAPEGVAAVALRPVPPASQVPDTWVIARVGGCEVEIGVAGASLAWLVSRLEPAFDLLGAADDLRPVILEAACAPWIEAIEDRIGRRIEIHSVEGHRGDAQTVTGGVDLEVQGTRIPVTFRTEPELARSLGRWVSSLPLARTALDEAGVPLSLRIGFTELTLFEAAKLQPGTGLLIEHRAADPVLVVAESLFARCLRTPQDVQLQADPAEPTGAERKWIMNDDDAQSTAWKSLPGGLSNLPVRLVAEVGRLTLTVAEVSKLQAGSLLDFGTLDDAVAIYAGGVHLADGRLVEIDGRSLVRIERLVLA